MVMVALIVVFYLLRYFFASATAYTSALAPMMIAAALAMPEIPLPVFCLMVGAAIGLGSDLHHTPPDPVRFTTVVVICQRRITGDWGRFLG